MRLTFSNFLQFATGKFYSAERKNPIFHDLRSIIFNILGEICLVRNSLEAFKNRLKSEGCKIDEIGPGWRLNITRTSCVYSACSVVYASGYRPGREREYEKTSDFGMMQMTYGELMRDVIS
jgi:hypothetical protein